MLKTQLARKTIQSPLSVHRMTATMKSFPHRHMPRTRLILGASLVVLLCWSHEARALDSTQKASILELSRDAKRDFDAGRFLDASLKFQMAFERAKVASLALYAARASVRAGAWVTAAAQYRTATNAPPNELWLGDKQSVAREQARLELVQLEAKLPRLVIDSENPRLGVPVSVSLDDKSLVLRDGRAELPVNPGTHVIVFRYADTHLSREVTAKEAERLTLTLRFPQPTSATSGVVNQRKVPARPTAIARRFELSGEPDEPAPLKKERLQGAPNQRSPWRTVGWIGVGVGVTSIAVGSIAALVVDSQYRDYEDTCPDGVCRRGDISQDDVDSYNLLRTTSLTTLIAGAVLGAAGTTILLATPSTHSGPTVSLHLTPTGAYLQGAL
jgi:hypothetical protein